VKTESVSIKTRRGIFNFNESLLGSKMHLNQPHFGGLPLILLDPRPDLSQA
jgi:hypothetical protein